jgi:hypothetical protein
MTDADEIANINIGRGSLDSLWGGLSEGEDK